jgi:small subunit ribosomal protein S4
MARYTGPKDKISRRFATPIFGPTKYLERKNYPPGMHGPKGSRRKSSEYSQALAEKQKLRYQYGILEKQFRRFFEIASNRRGVTGEILLQLLETRLDNVVYRLGFANSRNAARQMVGHGHIAVNGRKTDVSSFICKPGDVVSVRENQNSRRLATKNMELTGIAPVPDWLTANKEQFSGNVARIPTREEIAPIVNEQLIVELYSKA